MEKDMLDLIIKRISDLEKKLELYYEMLKVEKIQDKDIVCKIIHGGTLTNSKSINIPKIYAQMLVHQNKTAKHTDKTNFNA